LERKYIGIVIQSLYLFIFSIICCSATKCKKLLLWGYAKMGISLINW